MGKLGEANEDIGTTGENSEQSDVTGLQKESVSRRSFIKKIGTVTFAATVVGLTNTTHSSCPACGGGNPDSCCTDNGDENCGETLTAPPFTKDTDENCSTTDNDENCQTGEKPDKDEDENCTSVSTDPDQGCGDCNDNHDSDQHCSVDGDVDEMCGHRHMYPGQGGDTDDNCSTEVVDDGCGSHHTVNGTWTDDDEYCAGGCPPPSNPDANCSTATTDENCSTTNPYGTHPDEHCGSGGDTDEGCEFIYDRDANCGTDGDSDEACGGRELLTDGDENCGTDGDTDEHCGHWPDEDQNCGKVVGDTDESCWGIADDTI